MEDGNARARSEKEEERTRLYYSLFQIRDKIAYCNIENIVLNHALKGEGFGFAVSQFLSIFIV